MREANKKLHSIKEAIKKTHQTYLDFERTHDEFLLWLSQFTIPTGTSYTTWEKALESFPDQSPDCAKPDSGLRLRFLLKLYTTNHKYIISIVECFNSDAAGVGILSVHVNLDHSEYNLQKSLEMNYKNSYDNSLKPKQTICAEPFTIETFIESLNQAGLAILGNELSGNSVQETQPTVTHTVLQKVDFPEAD